MAGRISISSSVFSRSSYSTSRGKLVSHDISRVITDDLKSQVGQP